MKLKGYNATLVHNCRWRYADPARDLTLEEQPVQSNHVVIVREKDCKFVRCTGKEVEGCQRNDVHEHCETKDAPQYIRLNYGGTWYGFEEWTFSPGKKDWYLHVWFVHKGHVYRAERRADQPPEFARLRLFRKGIIAGKGRELK